MSSIKRIEHAEVVLDEGFEESEEIGSYFRKRVKIGCDERKTGLENQVDEIGEEIRT